MRAVLFERNARGVRKGRGSVSGRCRSSTAGEVTLRDRVGSPPLPHEHGASVSCFGSGSLAGSYANVAQAARQPHRFPDL